MKGFKPTKQMPMMADNKPSKQIMLVPDGGRARLGTQGAAMFNGDYKKINPTYTGGQSSSGSMPDVVTVPRKTKELPDFDPTGRNLARRR